MDHDDHHGVIKAALESVFPDDDNDNDDDDNEKIIDDDTYEYIHSALSEDPCDKDTREAVQQIIVSTTEDMDAVDGVQLCQSLFELIDLSFS
eukprot:CAMPEP_0178932624 /NCGR_PEP_ID=MMETSP0786-20121207/22743_1 /TAXON_ID=186022 /ORGANISM="Thalassionema frauenfeldii, Strain CCMP 1798" /LENGTH=91 /DNA_ID=CAMNT_0020609981 /DNA_START=112 /DNA_END=383 /DNA_ORIENTATION=+